MTDNELANNAATALNHAMNSFSAGSNAKIILDSILNDHPTIQQAFIGNLVLNSVHIMAKKWVEGNYDGRNEIACKYCYKMWEAIKDDVMTTYDVISRSYENWIRLPLI